MTKKINSILNQVLENITPNKKEQILVEEKLKEFLKKIKQNITKLKIDAEIFIGGSYAKKTMIKKDVYDIDIFIRFSKKYADQDLTNLTKKILNNFPISQVKGSRNYFKLNVNSNFYLEIVPVIKVNNPREAENITDLSYSHVRYVRKKVKSTKILDEIKLAKAFCHANKTYGAESYVKGFSGYALELLIIHYKSFLKFLKELSKTKKEKTIIDIEKIYKNNKQILMDLNESKLESPIILIDPTHKHRNALAALSSETYLRFKKEAKKFLKNPSMSSFEIKKVDLNKIKQIAKKKNYEFILIDLKTKKQAGDIAGTKLLKFYNHFSTEMNTFFDIKNKGFNYNNKHSARCFFVVKRKKKIILSGPYKKDLKNVKKFKKEHKNTFIKKKKVYAKQMIDFTLKQFILKWKNKNKKKLKEMTISGFLVV